MAYILTLMVFSVIQAYTVVLVVYLLVKDTRGSAVHLVLDEETIKTAHWGILGADIALTALVGTYGAHLIASIFQLRLWRLLTTWWADLIGMSCVANIMMVYAFCNWRDVILRVPTTDNTSALPQATSQKDEKSAFIEEVDRLQLDIDTQFSEAVQRALKPPDAEGDGWEPMSLEDSYKSFRTYLVLLWIFSNILLVIYCSATGTNRFCFTVST
ncbi:chitin synthase-domain-containing protein [Penicillium malachiteum]|nr:chitin synthase-domain-containing protein [Penicillium malachiteum]